MANDPSNHPTPPSRRRAIVALRWTLVAGWTGFIALALPAIPSEGLASVVVRCAAYALLSFLLANALWQHMPLKSACLIAACAACVLGGVADTSQSLVLGQAGALTQGGPGLVGAVVGALVAYPALQRIDRIVSSKTR